jgi:hypothetical protein
MWRWMIVALVAANGLFWMWGHDGLRALGLGPSDVSEPLHMKEQIQPEAMRVTPQSVPLENSLKSGAGVTILPPAEPEKSEIQVVTPTPVETAPVATAASPAAPETAPARATPTTKAPPVKPTPKGK